MCYAELAHEEEDAHLSLFLQIKEIAQTGWTLYFLQREAKSRFCIMVCVCVHTWGGKRWQRQLGSGWVYCGVELFCGCSAPYRHVYFYMDAINTMGKTS